MQPQTLFMTKRLRLSGSLIIVGLVVQALSLMWNHPLSFIAFISLGGLFLAAGIVVYLLALVTNPADNFDEPARDKADTQTVPH
jgi:hypothetical protein